MSKSNNFILSFENAVNRYSNSEHNITFVRLPQEFVVETYLYKFTPDIYSFVSSLLYYGSIAGCNAYTYYDSIESRNTKFFLNFAKENNIQFLSLPKELPN